MQLTHSSLDSKDPGGVVVVLVRIEVLANNARDATRGDICHEYSAGND